jgi:hypothetical protein
VADPFPLLPVDSLAAPNHRFRCDRYHATILVSACLKRQEVSAEQQIQFRLQVVKDRLDGDYEKCLTCPVGAQIRRQVTAAGG